MSGKLPLSSDLKRTSDAALRLSAVLGERVRARRVLRHGAAACLQPVQLAQAAAVIEVLWRLAAQLAGCRGMQTWSLLGS